MTRSLLEEMGLDRETVTWEKLAACQGMTTNLFFEDYESDPTLAESMDSICISCPVARECLADAFKRKDDGLRGGIYLSNGKMDRQHNQHKSPETWEKIRELHTDASS